MKNILTPVVVALLAGLTSSVPAAEPGGELVTNTISGVVRFTNTDPDILARLGAPGDEGITAISVSAYTDPPAALTATTFRYTDQRLANDYELIVQVDEAGFVYHVLATMSLDTSSEGYYSAIYDSPLLASNGPPAVVNIEECVGLVELRYQRANGDPVAAGGGRVKAIETATDRLRADVGRQAAGLTGSFLVVPSGVELRLHIEIDTGTDLYADRLTHAETRIVTVACDETQVVIVTIPEAGTLGTITGSLDMLGEFELSTEGYLEFLGRSSVIGRGPMGNQRNDLLPGDNVALPSSGTFILENLAPSALTDPAEPWRVQAEMHFRTGRRFEYFMSPALGQGENPGVTVTAGETVDLGDTFQMNPGFIVGSIFLKGPPEFGETVSALRGLSPVDHFDTNGDGIPDGVGINGIGSSYVTASGVDTIAAGATYSASGGYAGAGFEGAFNPVSSAYEGDYELVVAGLNGEGSIWKRDSLSLTIYNPGTNGGPYVNQVVYVTDTAPTPLTVMPGERLISDVRVGLAEVCVRFRSSGAVFFSPRIRFSTGTLDGPDFENNERHHSTYIDVAVGLPLYSERATNEAVVTMYLPEGTYDLKPYVSTLNAEGVESETELNAINDISVVAGERLCIEECLRIVITAPVCSPTFGFITYAEAFSCDSTLTNLSLITRSVDFPGVRLGYSDIRILEPAGIPRATLQTAHGLWPEFDGYPPEYYSNLVITAEARDTKGRIATRQIFAHYDFTPPILNCSDITVSSANGVDAVVDYNPSTSSNDVLVCVPPSGSTFPVGITAVNCTARDLCRNTNTCSFNVTVRGSTEDCVLRIALTQISPPEVTLTWDCAATLQSAGTVDGPWTSIAGATSPYPTPADGPQKFFRLCLSGDCSGVIVGDCNPAGSIAYEPFDYAPATALNGLNGGTGFSDAWTPTIGGVNYTIADGSLAFDSLCTNGGRMQSIMGHTQMGRHLSATFGADGTTRYFSFLLRPEGVLHGGDLGGFHGLQLQGEAGALFIGKPGGAGGGVTAPYVLEEVGGGGQVLSTVAPVVGETVFLVVKAEFAAGDDTFTLYVNPTPGSPEPVGSVVKSDVDIGSTDYLLIYSGGEFSLDEIRLGETFESVTPRQ